MGERDQDALTHLTEITNWHERMSYDHGVPRSGGQAHIPLVVNRDRWYRFGKLRAL